MYTLVAALLLVLHAPSAPAGSIPVALQLEEAISLALDNDPWLAGSRFRQQALADEAIASASLPDPKLSLAAGNFPVDTFDIGQEPMTQVSVGISQVFPRGDSRALGRRQKEQLSAQEPLLRFDRQQRVALDVTKLWLAAYEAQESIGLIKRNRALFDYLADAARAGYAAALGGARQQDLIRAQLEITRLEDRLSALQLRRESAQRRLSEWVGPRANGMLSTTPGDTQTLQPMELLESIRDSEQQAFELVQNHPALIAFDKRIEAMTTAVDLARQGYKPEWGVVARYGYRDDDINGEERADLFTLGVTVDLPVFTHDRQDRRLGAAVARAEALKTDRLLLARRMVADLHAAIARLKRLNERNTLYNEALLPQMSEQAAAALAAYNNDDGDFAEAVRARIDELDAALAALSLAVEREGVIAQINYLLAATTRTGSADPGPAAWTGLVSGTER